MENLHLFEPSNLEKELITLSDRLSKNNESIQSVRFLYSSNPTCRLRLELLQLQRNHTELSEQIQSVAEEIREQEESEWEPW